MTNDSQFTGLQQMMHSPTLVSADISLPRSFFQMQMIGPVKYWHLTSSHAHIQGIPTVWKWPRTLNTTKDFLQGSKVYLLQASASMANGIFQSCPGHVIISCCSQYLFKSAHRFVADLSIEGTVGRVASSDVAKQ